jgi:GDP/UDP-N,N'-diacetylbacillosamine 2-epimerase (hydrolysing)
LKKRKIAVLTVARSDFGRYLPVLRALRDDDTVDLQILPSGNHFDPKFGSTIDEINNSGFEWVQGLEIHQASDSPETIGHSIAIGTEKLATYFARETPDLLVVLGDRFEMLAGVNAALGFNLPVAHIHGGAVTEGAIDELVRHALTKMSHLHCVSIEEYAQRLKNMGEESWRVHVTGAPGLDDLADLVNMNRQELSTELNLDDKKPLLLACFHPVTVEYNNTKTQISSLLSALTESGHQIIFTYPNTDRGSSIIIEAIEGFAKNYGHGICVLKNAGTKLFTNILANVDAMIGNSSSAIVEAPSFKLPAINIGIRQEGKLKAKNIIECGYGTGEISAAITQAMSHKFRINLADLTNPYGDGHSGPRIAKILVETELGPNLLRKKFVD